MRRFTSSLVAGMAMLAIWSADASACNGGHGRAVPTPQTVRSNGDDTDLDQLLAKRAKAAFARRAAQQPEGDVRPAVGRRLPRTTQIRR